MMRAVWLALLLALPAQAAEPLVLERTIALHNVRGRIDHMAFDPGRKRLIVAELGNDTVDVIDVAAGVPLHRFTGLREPQGVGYAAACRCHPDRQRRRWIGPAVQGRGLFPGRRCRARR